MSPHSAGKRRETTAPILTVALLSACVLAYEVLLMRLFSIVQWHHFAYMIISLALLGYGVSGTVLSIARRALLQHFEATFVANVFLFALSSVACFAAAQQVSFNAEEILWDLRQPARLAAVYLLLAVPFFFGANAIALTLMRYADRVSAVYGADLFGAGVGSVAVIGLLMVAFPLSALTVIGLGAVAVAALAAVETGRRTVLAIALLAVGLPCVWLAAPARLELSEYKGLSQILRIAGTRVIAERSSPLGLLSVVESPDVPLRYAPGLGLLASREPPAQLGVFTDGDAMSAITRDDGSPDALAYLDQMTSALPYHLVEPRDVLVLGAGGGADVLQARAHGAVHIDAVELNAQMVDLVNHGLAGFSGGLDDRPGVSVHVADARGYAASTTGRYDVIQLSLLDSFGASAAGLHALSESYLYTVEAFGVWMSRLAPGGYLAVSRWAKLPPRDTLKLAATAAAALEREGVEHPERRLALIRGWQTTTLLIKNGEVTADDVRIMKRFVSERAFDVAWYPGMNEGEANRRNVLAEPYFYRGMKALLGPDAETFMSRYKFELHPATDDRPYFHHFLKLRELPELLSLRDSGGMALVEWGYLVLLATLVQAVAASVVLILLPLRLLRRGGGQQRGRGRVFVYFSAIGLAFLFIEIAFMQRFILFLHHPIYAVATVLCAFLVFAGMGSMLSGKLVRRTTPVGAAAFAVAGIAVAAIFIFWGVVPGLVEFSDLGLGVRLAITVASVAPVALMMGMPFPLALTELGRNSPALVPWAWGINGCASVVSAVLATLLAVHAGFSAVVIAALLLYAVAWLAFPRASAG